MRPVIVAAVQMEVSPAPTAERLARAGRLAAAAASAGADLVVLPELFNTGYAYTDDHYARAEPAEGETIRWMKQTSSHYQVHLAGSLLLREAGEIYNAMFITAPDGQTWRCDKRYPWGWERAFFRPARPGQPAAVAHTRLGDLGMLICWDVAHPHLWRKYAGLVEMLIVCSSPPQADTPIFWLPDETWLETGQLGPYWRRLKGQAACVFHRTLPEQAAWLGVPSVCSTACGQFDSPVPNSAACLLSVVPGQPGLLRFLPQAGRMRMTAPMVDACQVISGEGKILAHRPQEAGEGFVTAQVDIPEQRPQPREHQPAARVSRLAYFLSDRLLPALMLPAYRKGRQGR